MFRTVLMYFPFACALACFLLFVLPLRLKVRAQAIFAMIFLLCASKFVCFEKFGGDAFVPELPEKLIWFWNWACAGLYFCVPLAIVGFFFSRRLRVWLVPALAWSFAAIGVVNGLVVPSVEEVSFASARVPSSLDGYRIVQLSDLHVSCAARGWRTQAIVDVVNNLKPDLIVLTGDLADGDSSRRARDVAPLKDLCARDGVYFCTGNHEFYYDWFNWKKFYKEIGLKYINLKNPVRLRDDLLLLATDDPAHTMFEKAQVANEELLWKDATNGVFTLLLQHQPSPIFKIKGVSDHEVDLQLSGHTHGGIAPGLAMLTRMCNNGYLKGFQSREGGGMIYTSRGSGQWAGFPVRLFVPSEITLITLKRKLDM